MPARERPTEAKAAEHKLVIECIATFLAGRGRVCALPRLPYTGRKKQSGCWAGGRSVTARRAFYRFWASRDVRATACPDTSGRTPLLYCTACAPTSPASRARIRRSCARGLNSWLNPPPASRQPPSPRVLREAMAAFLCVGRPPTARATSHAACQPCMCEWPARDPTPQWQCAVRSGEWASPSRSRQWRSAASIELRGSWIECQWQSQRQCQRPRATRHRQIF